MFDPYHKWLGIPAKDQPPNYYRLLGVDIFESDADVIDTAANKQMAYIQSCATGQHMALSQKLLNEIATARLCLLNAKKKSDYDSALKAKHNVVPIKNNPPSTENRAFQFTPANQPQDEYLDVLAPRSTKKKKPNNLLILMGIGSVVAIGIVVLLVVISSEKKTPPLPAEKEVVQAASTIQPNNHSLPKKDTLPLSKSPIPKEPPEAPAKDIPEHPTPKLEPKKELPPAVTPIPAETEPLPKKEELPKTEPVQALDPTLLNLKPGSLQGRSGPQRNKLLIEGGGNDKTEAAVAIGLKWLASQQKTSGSWVIEGREGDVGATGLGVLPFLGAGHTHKQGAYVKNVSKGLDFLLSKQRKDGAFAETYDNAIATIAVCEAYGLSGDPKFKLPAQRAIDYIIAAQHQGGGWRYKPKEPGDTSATGWHFIALKTAEMVGLKVPKDSFKLVGTFLDGVAANDGGYGYSSSKSSYSCTPIALLCRQYLGWGPKRTEMLKGIEILNAHAPPNGGTSIYYYYYASQVMRHFGGEEWKTWNSKIQDLLLQRQSTDKDAGSWSPIGDEYAKAGGRLMVTSLSLLTLEVYYRHVPLFLSDRAKKE